jgi:hypothetical protein
MTPEDRRVISSLVAVPGRGRRGSPEDVLRHFGSADGRALGFRLCCGTGPEGGDRAAEGPGVGGGGDGVTLRGQGRT